MQPTSLIWRVSNIVTFYMSVACSLTSRESLDLTCQFAALNLPPGPVPQCAKSAKSAKFAKSARFTGSAARPNTPSWPSLPGLKPKTCSPFWIAMEMGSWIAWCPESELEIYGNL